MSSVNYSDFTLSERVWFSDAKNWGQYLKWHKTNCTDAPPRQIEVETIIRLLASRALSESKESSDRQSLGDHKFQKEQPKEKITKEEEEKRSIEKLILDSGCKNVSEAHNLKLMIDNKPIPYIELSLAFFRLTQSGQLKVSKLGVEKKDRIPLIALPALEDLIEKALKSNDNVITSHQDVVKFLESHHPKLVGRYSKEDVANALLKIEGNNGKEVISITKKQNDKTIPRESLDIERREAYFIKNTSVSKNVFASFGARGDSVIIIFQVSNRAAIAHLVSDTPIEKALNEILSMLNPLADPLLLSGLITTVAAPDAASNEALKTVVSFLDKNSLKVRDVYMTSALGFDPRNGDIYYGMTPAGYFPFNSAGDASAYRQEKKQRERIAQETNKDISTKFVTFDETGKKQLIES